jgi:hypothetical protein
VLILSVQHTIVLRDAIYEIRHGASLAAAHLRQCMVHSLCRSISLVNDDEYLPRCIQFDSYDLTSVKQQGRIYLATGGLSSGVPNHFFDTVLYGRDYLGRSLRFSIIGDVAGQGIQRWCLQEKGIIPAVLDMISFCGGIKALIEAGCTQRAVRYPVVLSNKRPEARRSYPMRQTRGFLSTSRDRKALFLAFQKGSEEVAGLTGEAAFTEQCPARMGIIGFSAANNNNNNTYDHPLSKNSMASRLDTAARR